LQHAGNYGAHSAPVLAPVIFPKIRSYRHFRRHQSFSAPDAGTSRRQVLLATIGALAVTRVSAPNPAPVLVPVILPEISSHSALSAPSAISGAKSRHQSFFTDIGWPIVCEYYYKILTDYWESTICFLNCGNACFHY